MKKAIIECVPNFSEGRDLNKINSIAEAIKKVSGVKLLHTDIGYDANRTVMTFAGEPRQVIKAAYDAVEVASQVIDMRSQSGPHPRLGATDVCPLIPIQGISMDEVIALSHELAHKVGNVLSIPVFLYEESSNLLHRKNLEDIRRGEYEGLADKISQADWKPDYGSAQFNSRSGATIIGARNFLIAYNINLSTKDVSIAKNIAKNVRTKSATEYSLPSLKAIGWYMDKYGCCQVSTNLTNYHITNLHEVYERCKSVAEQLNVDVAGSELIGLVPMEAMLEAGTFYHNIDTEPTTLINAAVKNLGLDTLSPFIINDRIVELLLK